MNESLRKVLEENDLKLTILIPVFLSVLGILIINNHLESFGIYDYKIFKIQSVYVGAMFVIILGVVVFCLNVVTECFKTGSFILWLLSVATGLILTGMLIYSFPSMDYYRISLQDLKNLDSFSPKTLSGLIRICKSGGVYLFLGTAGITCYLYNSLREKTEKSYRYIRSMCFSFIILIALLAWLVFIFILKFDKYNQFHDLVYFLASIGAVYFFLVHHVKGFLNFTKPCLSRFFVNYFFIFIALFGLLNTYTRGIYPFLPRSWGGGKQEAVNIVLRGGKAKEKDKVTMNEIVNKKIGVEIVHRADNGVLYIWNWKKKNISIIDESEVKEIIPLKWVNTPLKD
jgi:hypothetical protein